MSDVEEQKAVVEEQEEKGEGQPPVSGDWAGARINEEASRGTGAAGTASGASATATARARAGAAATVGVTAAIVE